MVFISSIYIRILGNMSHVNIDASAHVFSNLEDHFDPGSASRGPHLDTEVACCEADLPQTQHGWSIMHMCEFGLSAVWALPFKFGAKLGDKLAPKSIQAGSKTMFKK